MKNTFDAKTLSDILASTVPDRPVYVICDGRRYRIVEVKDRVLDRIELVAAKEPDE